MSDKQDKLLRLPEVMAMTGLGRTCIWAFEKANKFPPSIKISRRIIAWSEKSIQEWISQKRDAPRKEAIAVVGQNVPTEIPKTTRLQSCTMTARNFSGNPELLFENGGSDGPCYVIGISEVQQVIDSCNILLNREKRT